MPATENPPPAQLKDWFDEARYRHLADELSGVSPSFDASTFLEMTLEGLEQRSLMQRLHQCALAVDAALPGEFEQKLAVLQKLAPKVGHSFVSIFLCDFVAAFGGHDLESSMKALREFTKFGSAEFAVRRFIHDQPARALAIMRTWTGDENEHVRRLASEGARPRLPWGMKLGMLVKDPEPCGPLLEALKDDASEYVRKSVANHLNDITKDHPEWVLARLERWDLRKPHLRWIARHACRTLIKRGHPRALKLLGFGQKAEVVAELQVRPTRLKLGGRLHLEAMLEATSECAQTLAVDYVIHYVKSRGAAFEKVFKWKEIELPGGGQARLEKSQVLRDFTTRKHHPGLHIVELQVNGQRVARAGFELLV